VLELIESGGLSAVEEAVKKGLLPAAVLGAFLSSTNQDSELLSAGQDRPSANALVL